MLPRLGWNLFKTGLKCPSAETRVRISIDSDNCVRLIFVFHFFCRPENKEGKEGETEKTAEQENESDKTEKELEKDKVSWVIKFAA